MNKDVRLRFAEQGDLQAIVEIYNQAIANKTTADMFPLKVSDRQQWLNDHHPDSHPVYVAELDNKVVGWCSLSPYRPGRAAFRFTAEISYYVDYNFHGHKIGQALITHAIKDCKRLQLKNLFALILANNEKSVRFIAHHGFQKWGLMPNIADFDGVETSHLIYGLRLK